MKDMEVDCSECKERMKENEGYSRWNWPETKFECANGHIKIVTEKFAQVDQRQESQR